MLYIFMAAQHLAQGVLWHVGIFGAQVGAAVHSCFRLREKVHWIPAAIWRLQDTWFERCHVRVPRCCTQPSTVIKLHANGGQAASGWPCAPRHTLDWSVTIKPVTWLVKTRTHSDLYSTSSSSFAFSAAAHTRTKNNRHACRLPPCQEHSCTHS